MTMEAKIEKAMDLINQAQALLVEVAKAAGVKSKPQMFYLPDKNGKPIGYDSPVHKRPCECFSDEDIVKIIRVDRVVGKGTGSKVSAMTDADLVAHIRGHFGTKKVSGHTVTMWLRQEHQVLAFVA